MHEPAADDSDAPSGVPPTFNTSRSSDARPPAVTPEGFPRVVAALCDPGPMARLSGPPHGPPSERARRRRTLPSRDVILELTESLRAALFPTFFSDWDLSGESLHFYVGATLDRVLHALQEQIQRALLFRCDKDRATRLPADCGDYSAHAAHITASFLERLPAVRERLVGDVQAAFEGDPAALHPEEVIACYPGLRAMTDYRLAHELYALGVPVIPRIITEFAHGLTGIDIHPGATLGARTFIDHGTGVVIGETARIGDGVRIYQNVTLGAKSFPLDAQGRPIKGIPRHPIVEDDVILYAGATVLGRVTIGQGSVIGGNVWVTRDVPPHTVVTQSEARAEVFQSGAGI